MIDAISGYSSNHASNRYNRKFGDNSPNNFFQEDTVTITGQNSKKKQSELGAFLIISGCAGAFCMILNFLLNSENLLKTDFSAVKSIVKASAVVSLVSGACYAGFKGLEKIIDNSNKKDS